MKCNKCKDDEYIVSCTTNPQGKHHSFGDLPAVEWINGDKEWLLNGELHREDSPAIEWANGDKAWYLNKELHRDDGPAIEFSNGNATRKEWWLNGSMHKKVRYFNGNICILH